MWLKPRRWLLILGSRNTVLGRPLSTITKLKLSVNTSTWHHLWRQAEMGRQHWRNCKEGATVTVSLAKAKLFLCWPKDFNSFLQNFYWECSVILFHLLVSQLGSEEQEQPAKNCLYRLQDNCSAPERPGFFLWTAGFTESPLYFNKEGPYFKLGIYYSPIRSSS